MNETEHLSNPENYKILIQIKKNRRRRRAAKYLNSDLNFVNDISQAMFFESIQRAEEMLPKVSKLSSAETRPRIVIKYLIPEKSQNINQQGACQCLE